MESSAAGGGCGDPGIGFAGNDVIHGHLIGPASLDIFAVYLGKTQTAGVGSGPGFEAGAAVPQLDRGADFA